MPLLSHRRLAVAKLSRTLGSRFRANIVGVVDLTGANGDDRWKNFRDVGEDEEDDIIDIIESEPIPILTIEFVSKIQSWRQTGHNSGVRGAGTSLSTFKRTKLQKY